MSLIVSSYSYIINLFYGFLKNVFRMLSMKLINLIILYYKVKNKLETQSNIIECTLVDNERFNNEHYRKQIQ